MFLFFLCTFIVFRELNAYIDNNRNATQVSMTEKNAHIFPIGEKKVTQDSIFNYVAKDVLSTLNQL